MRGRGVLAAAQSVVPEPPEISVNPAWREGIERAPDFGVGDALPPTVRLHRGGESR